MRILVTGAAGFIGSHLSERLLAAGHDLVALDALTPLYSPGVKRRRLERLRDQGAQTWTLDLAVDDLAPALSGVEAVYHLAAQPGLSDTSTRADFARNNVRATERLADAVSAQPSVRAVVYASSSSVYGKDATGAEDAALQPASDYGRTKRDAERVLRDAAQKRRADASHWDTCVLRLFSVYGPRERPHKLLPKAIRCTLDGRAFPLYAGSEDHRRSFTYVGDVVDGMVAALTHFDRCAGTTINLGSPVSVTTLEALQTVADVVGRPTCIRRAPARAGDQRRTRARIDRARRLLGFAPTTTLRDGIAAEVDWIRTQRMGAP